MMNSTPTFHTVMDAVSFAEKVQDRGYHMVREDGSDRFYSYHEMISLARQRAAALQQFGVSKGDRVALIIPDNEEFVISFLACLISGILAVPLYPPHALGKLDTYLKTTGLIIKNSGARLVVTTGRVATLLWRLTDEAQDIKTIITTDKLGETPASAFAPVPLAPEDLAFLQFTSGSTAAPKGVMVTHRSLVSNCVAIVRDGTKVHPKNDKGLSWLPLYHDMGLIGFVVAPMFVPMTVILVPTMNFLRRPLLWFDLIHQYGATVTFAPNFAYSLLTRRATDEQLKKWDLSNLRNCGCGAEPISPQVMRDFMAHFAKAGLRSDAFLPCYGMAEATLAISFKSLGDVWRTDVIDGATFREQGRAAPSVDPSDQLEFVSCGKPLPGHTVRAIDTHGQGLPERQVGELEFSGPSLTAGYFNNTAATHAAFVDNALRTGDLGYLADGHVYVTGRKKDLIIINGRNYVPQAIEWLVETIPSVRRGNVVAFSRPGSGTEELVIVCEAKTDSPDQLRAQIMKTLNEEISLAPADIVLLESGALPKTTSGKLQRRKTFEMYADGTLGREGSRTPGQAGQALQLTGHVMKAMISRVKHTVRRTLKSDS